MYQQSLTIGKHRHLIQLFLCIWPESLEGISSNHTPSTTRIGCLFDFWFLFPGLSVTKSSANFFPACQRLSQPVCDPEPKVHWREALPTAEIWESNRGLSYHSFGPLHMHILYITSQSTNLLNSYCQVKVKSRRKIKHIRKVLCKGNLSRIWQRDLLRNGKEHDVERLQMRSEGACSSLGSRWLIGMHTPRASRQENRGQETVSYHESVFQDRQIS